MRLLVALVTCVLALLLAAPAGAISRAQANAIALEALGTETMTSPVIVFGLPKALRASDVVSEFAKPGLLKAPGKVAWLFWADLDPGAMYQHASRLVLVDDKTGRVTKTSPLTYYPLVNGAMPPYLRTSAGYNGSAYHVYASAGTEAPPRESFSPADRPRAPPGLHLLPRPLELPPGSMQGDCLLMVVATPAPVTADPKSKKQSELEASNLKAAMKAWNGLAASVDIPAYVATSAGPIQVEPGLPLEPPAFGRQVADRSLAAAIEALVGSEGCTDILLYVFGHGNPPPGWVDPHTQQAIKGGGPPAILTGAQNPAQPGGKPSLKTLTPGGLGGAISAQQDKATFKVVIESCFAERFDDALMNLPNVKLLMGSSSPEETSLFNASKTPSYKNKKQPAVPNPDQPEFTHGVTEGFKATLADAAEVAALDEKGDSLLARLLKAAFEKEKPNDRGALNDRTHPSVHDSLVATTKVTLCGTWRHNGPGDSDVLVYVSTDPPLAGGKVSWRVRAGITRVVAYGTGQTTLDSQGKASFYIAINDYGTFEVEVTVEKPDGSEIVAVETVLVPVVEGPGPVCSSAGPGRLARR